MKRFFYFIILFAGCKDVYDPPIKNAGYNYLVVEGTIVDGDSTFIHLSRTVAVSDTSVISAETNATVNVESGDGETYQLQNQFNGVYFSSSLNIDPAKTYRLHIFTADGKEYASDFVPVKLTPPIDSVSWKLDPKKGVTVYANTHDAENKTLYYRWDYTETWEHRVRYESNYIYENGVLRVRRPDEHIYRCWTIIPSSSITIASTTGLSTDIVFEKPLIQIPYGSEEISEVYSVLVKQYALTKEAFEFWQDLKKNTEQLGSIFDPQPFADFGNMHCITDPAEPVIGFITASSIAQQRIYIHRSDLSSWSYSLPVCETDTLGATDNIDYILTGGAILPVYYINLDLLAAGAECVDCRLHGGSTLKPPYMP